MRPVTALARRFQVIDSHVFMLQTAKTFSQAWGVELADGGLATKDPLGMAAETTSPKPRAEEATGHTDEPQHQVDLQLVQEG